MVFIGKCQQARGNILNSCSSKCFQSLLVRNTVIFFIRDDENGSIPVFHKVDWRELSVVIRSCRIPYFSERWKSSPVRCNNDITIRSHQLEVPSVRPELADGALRSALAIKQGWILFLRIEIGRIDNPCKYFFIVG